jgi:hypothetical protein
MWWELVSQGMELGFIWMGCIGVGAEKKKRNYIVLN